MRFTEPFCGNVVAHPSPMIRSLRRILATPTAATAISTLLAAQLCLFSQTTNTADRVDPASAITGQPAYIPMTETQRLTEFAKDTANPISLFSSAASAGIGQWRNRPREWKQGGEAYGLRYGSSYAEHIVNETLKFGASSLLHEDNRYVRSGQAAVGARIGYALGNTFTARGDDGRRRLSRSRLLAFAGAALISRLWQPRSSNSLHSAGVNFGTSVGVTMGFQVAHEFLPWLP
jgi:hypothetical protein